MRGATNQVHPPRCLITGGTGFIGARLGLLLGAQGWRVRVLDRSPSASMPFDDLIVADAGDAEGMREACSGVDVVFHLAGSTDLAGAEADPGRDVAGHCAVARVLSDAAHEAGVRRIVYVSSGGTVYGLPEIVPIPETHPTRPMSAVGQRCLAVERVLLEHDTTIVLRVANAFGPGQRTDRSQGLVAVALDRLSRGADVEVFGDGLAVRDYVSVDDVATAASFAARYGGRSRIFNIGSGHGLSVRAVVDQIAAALGVTARLRSLPTRTFDVPLNVLDAGLARRELGWRPTRSFATEVSALAVSAAAAPISR